MFVVVEGIEGSGKSTLVAGLAARLGKERGGVVATREPGGTQLGDAVRAIFLDRFLTIEPLAEAFLVNAARAQHVEEVIRPALASGGLVVCDRFTDSTLAYQGYGRGMDLELLRALCDFATGGVNPDLVLLVDLPVHAARARLGDRAGAPDRIENEDDGFHERVRDGFLELARGPRHRVLDGALPPRRLLEEALRQL
ncbi:MAG: dTMP kinase [Candidatus Eremiobacteraeota bacterium]|nr:dTMP kinase [Candidatus Eremiobacteraeota bacterium]MBV8497728.1 dTMP kinase [Candidatus Eremiobacteraeota bacterium]